MTRTDLIRGVRWIVITAAWVFVPAHPGAAQSPALDAEQSAFLTLINNYRAQNGAGPLQISSTLQLCSQWLSDDMAGKNYYSHTDSIGRDPFARMAAFGYSYLPEAEDIAAGHSDAQSTFNDWQAACDPDSTGACTYTHRQNMLNPSYTALGIGRAYNAKSTYGWYWTTDFGGYVPGTAGAPGPSILSGGVVPVYSTSAAITPGEWVSIYGANLASGTAAWTGNFPTSLAGATVTVNGRSAYLSLASPGQINFQAPDDTTSGTVQVVVTNGGASAAAAVTLAQYAPSFLLLDSKHVAGIILRSNGSGAYGGGSYDIIGPTGTSLGYRTVAAKAGDTIELFATGLGPTSPAVASGQPFSGAAQTTSPVTLQIGGTRITPAFAGLSGAGLDQINLTIPAGLGAGDISIQATAGGAQTQTGVVISLQ